MESVTIAGIIFGVLALVLFFVSLPPLWGWRREKHRAHNLAKKLINSYWYSDEYQYDGGQRFVKNFSVVWKSVAGASYAYEYSLTGSDGRLLSGSGADWKGVQEFLKAELLKTEEKFAEMREAKRLWLIKEMGKRQ